MIIAVVVVSVVAAIVFAVIAWAEWPRDDENTKPPFDDRGER